MKNVLCSILFFIGISLDAASLNVENSARIFSEMDSISEMSWSPDSKWLGVVHGYGEEDGAKIRLHNLDENSWREIDLDEDYVRNVFFDNSSNYLFAVVVSREKPLARIVKINLENFSVQPLDYSVKTDGSILLWSEKLKLPVTIRAQGLCPNASGNCFEAISPSSNGLFQPLDCYMSNLGGNLEFFSQPAILMARIPYGGALVYSNGLQSFSIVTRTAKSSRIGEYFVAAPMSIVVRDCHTLVAIAENVNAESEFLSSRVDIIDRRDGFLWDVIDILLKIDSQAVSVDGTASRIAWFDAKKQEVVINKLKWVP